MHRHVEKCGPYNQYLHQYAENALDSLYAYAEYNYPSDSGPMISERLREMLL